MVRLLIMFCRKEVLSVKKYVKPKLDFVTITAEEKYAAGSRDVVICVKYEDTGCVIVSQCPRM